MDVKEDINQLFNKLIHNDENISSKISDLYKEIDTILQSNNIVNQKLDKMLNNKMLENNYNMTGGTKNSIEINNFVEHIKKLHNKTESWAKEFRKFIYKYKITTICDFTYNLNFWMKTSTHFSCKDGNKMSGFDKFP